MWKNGLSAAAVAALVVGMAAACDDEDDLTDPDAEFSASLTGAAEVPPVDTDATGSATFDLNDAVMSFTVDVSNITGVTASHIHGPAAAGANAGVIVPLFAGPEGGTGAISGELASGTFTAADITATGVSMDSLLVLMGNGNAYVNVHTVEHSPGEIRGQIVVD
jgi:hypothetical protein